MPLPDQLRERVVSLLTEGHSDIEVYRRTGVARTTVARYRKAQGLPGYFTSQGQPACRNGHPWPENRRQYSNGWTYCWGCKRAGHRRWWAENYQPVQPDDIAIERAVAGDPPERLTPRERAAAVRQLDARRLSASVIASRVGCHERTVYRIRKMTKGAA
jgi:transposase